jgi:hypothetical protein
MTNLPGAQDAEITLTRREKENISDVNAEHYMMEAEKLLVSKRVEIKHGKVKTPYGEGKIQHWLLEKGKQPKLILSFKEDGLLWKLRPVDPKDIEPA